MLDFGGEIWKDIKGYEGLYQVSSYGRIKSLARTTSQNKRLPERLRVLSVDKYGYMCVNLSKDGKVKLLKVHRLVCEAFIENPDRKPQVNHIDGNKGNNHVENLEWCTGSENIIHAFETGLKEGFHISKYGEKNSRCKVSDQEAEEIRRLHHDEKITYSRIAERFQISPHQVSRIVRGEQRQKGSFVYVKDNADQSIRQ